MKTMTMTILMLISVNTFAFSKKVHAEFNSDGSTICSDRSAGKGNGEGSPVSTTTADEDEAASN